MVMLVGEDNGGDFDDLHGNICDDALLHLHH